MPMDPDLVRVLKDVRVLELSTITKDGGVNTRPMAATWMPGTGRVFLTTPLATPQKVFNIRRDARVALFYSDFTGSGLSGAPAVLVQGTAEAPDVVAAPHDIPDYWGELFRKYPKLVDDFADDEARKAMDWYYWRLPISVGPDHVHTFDAAEFGGAWEPFPPENATMNEQIADAIQRYPTAVLCSRDERGYPFSTRAIVTGDPGSGNLRVQPTQPFAGRPGQANLLWHRHNGHSGEMHSLLVAGRVTNGDGTWTFVPERLPGEAESGHETNSYEAWIADARTRSQRYLERRGLEPPEIDWKAFAGYAPS
ncbi:pyridoxamine 5'-phosphate oxidase family protein [Phytoactinopolyspora halotolerans]|uniref:Pyridoxamine 5'-phosphate oxidase family protein n=1 Tax=Phytoactinopolyspora halotolerans TaxID=1981512 RepID=A0A6L9S2C5_9ACTN|nr:pyridoxamine 5'-phosphate oxidase family protein [Phytoactinopolyspora halotolerans]NED99198.1 pyridoxamine 5'-phosphate oxidase family protein [Phytoactinopolyspora halotolerans]